MSYEHFLGAMGGPHIGIATAHSLDDSARAHLSLVPDFGDRPELGGGEGGRTLFATADMLGAEVAGRP